MMLPKPPPKLGSLGYLYFPPLRVQGFSVAGEATSVMVPEYEVCFDIGLCAKTMLASKFVALTHGHMDHVAGLPYYFSQRWFQGMGMGVCLCDKRIEPAVRNMMLGWVDLEQQKTSHEIIGLDEGDEFPIKSNLLLTPFRVDHTVPAVGYCVVERRSKLKPELLTFPQEKLRELKKSGVEITRELRVPQLAYIGDTLPGPYLLREEVRKARVVVIECTFFEPEHKERALIGKHVHVDDIAELLAHLDAPHVVLTHVSRRTNLGFAKKALLDCLGEQEAQRVHILMDYVGNRDRYEKQKAQAEAGPDAAAPADAASTYAPSPASIEADVSGWPEHHTEHRCGDLEDDEAGSSDHEMI